ncbi:MAG TPA: hypothetical protein VMB49_17060 [Acidobacteriaceae bacterium]|nr:hypothetical protein [Acidobacteriaceae bacterium]
MSAHGCCLAKGGQHDERMRIAQVDPHPRSLIRRSIRFAARLTPMAIVAVLPKCPACLVAYVALATGVGISLNLATYFRFFLIVACVSASLYFMFKGIYRRRSCGRLTAN